MSEAHFNLREVAHDARNLGLNVADIADIIAKWGPVALDVAVKALRNGFSVDLVMEVLDAFGVEFLNTLVDKKLAHLDTPTEVDYEHDVRKVSAPYAEEQASLPYVSDALLEVLIKLIPTVFDKYGPALLKLIEDALLKVLENSQSKENLASTLREVLR